MFNYKSVEGFCLRCFIFFIVFSTYPLLVYFEMTCINLLFFRNQQVSSIKSLIMNASCTITALLFALFYPNVGTVLSYFGAVSGLLIIYCLPVFVHLKYKKTLLLNPLLAEAIQKNKFHAESNLITSPKITLSDDFIKNRKDF